MWPLLSRGRLPCRPIASLESIVVTICHRIDGPAWLRGVQVSGG
jgi:hypothetical protein